MMRESLCAAVVAVLAIAGAAQADGDVAAGKAKAASCAKCHGKNGEGVKSNPTLAGKPESQVIQALNDDKSGKRSHSMMKAIASSLSDQDMANLGAYYASLKAN